MTDTIKQELLQAQGVLNEFINNEENIKSIERAAQIMIDCIKSGGKIIACGNGGSMSDAMHFASELTGRYRKNRPAIPALAISDPGHLSCVANDFGYGSVFDRYLEAMFRPEDVLLAITTSGTSNNVYLSTLVARRLGSVIGLTGNGGGAVKVNCDVEIRVPHTGYADRIQEIHIKVIHILVNLIEKGLGYAD